MVQGQGENATLLDLLRDEADDLEAAVVLERDGRGFAGQLLDLLLALPPIPLALQLRDEAHRVDDVLHVGLQPQVRVLHEALRTDDALDVQPTADRQVVGVRRRPPTAAADTSAAAVHAVHLPLSPRVSIEQTRREHGLAARVVAEVLRVAHFAAVAAVIRQKHAAAVHPHPRRHSHCAVRHVRAASHRHPRGGLWLHVQPATDVVGEIGRRVV